MENDADRTTHRGYYLQKVGLKYYNGMTHDRNFFDQPINIDIKTNKNIRKIITGQGDD